MLWTFEANDRARHVYERAGWLPDGGRRELFDTHVAPGDSYPAPQIRYRRRL